MKMDKSKIKEVAYSGEKKNLVIKFNDGSAYGETGNTAVETMKQLINNDIDYIDVDENKLK